MTSLDVVGTGKNFGTRLYGTLHIKIWIIKHTDTKTSAKSSVFQVIHLHFMRKSPRNLSKYELE